MPMAGPGGGRKNVGGTVESWSGAFAFGAGAWLGLAAVVACNDVLDSGAAGRAVVFSRVGAVLSAALYVGRRCLRCRGTVWKRGVVSRPKP